MPEFKVGDKVSIIGGCESINIPEDEGPMFVITDLPEPGDVDYYLQGAETGGWLASASEMQPWVDPNPSGIELITAERKRQVEVEGFTTERDAQYDGGDLLGAAWSYIWAAQVMSLPHTPTGPLAKPRQWPWSDEWWKPSPDPVRNLAKAGALLAAEIDRLQGSKNQKTLLACSECAEQAVIAGGQCLNCGADDHEMMAAMDDPSSGPTGWGD